jgi:O-antigen ligase
VVRERLESIGWLAVGALPAFFVALAGFALPGVSSDDQPHSVRVQDGALFGVALLVGVAVVVGVAWRLERHPVRLSAGQRRRLWRMLLVAVPVAAVVLVVVGAAASRGPLTIHAGPGRFFRLGSSDRWQWWQESLHIFRDRPVAGSGAGTFIMARKPFAGETTSVASEPHNLPLQFLSELGVVGLVLFLLVLVAAGFVVVCALRRLRGAERPAACALAAICAAWLVHAAVEFDWEYVALTGPVALVVGSLAASGRDVRERAPSRLLAVAAVAVGAGAIFSVATPWAADRKLNDSIGLASAGRYADAVQAARDAHSLNPLSGEALLAWADAEDLLAQEALRKKRRDDARAHAAEADRIYRKATSLQPENPAMWRARGEFELDTLGDKAAARVSLERAVALDPRDEIARKLLDEATAPG